MKEPGDTINTYPLQWQLRGVIDHLGVGRGGVTKSELAEMVSDEAVFLKRRNMGYKKLKLLKDYLGLPMDPRPTFDYKEALIADKKLLVAALEKLRGIGQHSKALKIIEETLNAVK